MENNKSKDYSYRFLARVVLEAKTPISVGSGENDIITDALVATDVNGLPYIPGTTICGIIRHLIDGEHDKTKRKYTDSFFGFQYDSNEGHGSEIIFTEAKMIGADGKPVDGLQIIEWENDFYARYQKLPIRQHAKIDHKGVTVKFGKYDEQVVFKGTRFCFEIEMVSDNVNDFNLFKEVLNQMSSETFRIGSGTRCGFGEIKIISCKTKQLNLFKPEDLNFYLNKSSLLTNDWQGNDYSVIDEPNTNWTTYELTLRPEDFFLFGAGYGDEEVDMTPIKSSFVSWEGNIPTIVDDAILIPATSIKGALAHRVAFHFNKLNGYYVGDDRAKVGNENIAVQELFGYENQLMKTQKRGNVVFSDIIEKLDCQDKILNHVSIDRFTGGSIDGALFSEKTIYGRGKDFSTKILVNKEAIQDDTIRQSFEESLIDICKGLLPLGGGVNRGNGCFLGELKCDGTIIYPKKA